VNKVGLLATLQARPGKEAEVEQFLRSVGPLVDAETRTTSWFAFRAAPATFGIFDTFAEEGGRSAHITGEIKFSEGPFRPYRRTLCRTSRCQVG
jgi:hypothetical protein